MRRALIAILALSLAAAACSSEEGAAPKTGDGAVASDEGASSDEVFLFRSDFEPVCNGATVSDAAPYEPDAPGPHPVMAFAGAAPDYGQSFVSVPDDWKTEIGEEELTQLVVCLDRTSETFVELCEGYEDEGLSWSVEVFDASYDLRVVAATDGREVARTTLEAPSTGCPFFSSFGEGDPNPKPDYATPDDALVSFLAEYVN